MSEKSLHEKEFLKKCSKCGNYTYIPELDLCLHCSYERQPSLVLYGNLLGDK